ncbi:MAG: sugar phosphate isomerase/epimerase family protein [Paracoccaceae bacterium]
MTEFSYQLYSSRNFGPLDQTISMLSEAGYRQVEGFGGVYGNPDALRGDLDRAGLSMTTGHFDLKMVEDTPEKAINIARSLGMKALFVPYLDAADRPTTAEGWLAFGKRLQEAGKPIRDAGLPFGWHNHDFEFKNIEGDMLPLDLILEGGPELALELDLAWVSVGGQRPSDWVHKYSDRLIAVHVKDIAHEGECLDEAGWEDVGHGTMDWVDTISAVRETACQFFVMEHDNPKDDARFARRSLAAANTF